MAEFEGRSPTMLIWQTLKREGVPLLCSEIAKWNDLTPGAVRRALHKMRDEGLVHQNDHHYWAHSDDGQGAQCADGGIVHDFKGQERCPSCGFEGIRLPARIDSPDD